MRFAAQAAPGTGSHNLDTPPQYLGSLEGYATYGVRRRALGPDFYVFKTTYNCIPE